MQLQKTILALLFLSFISCETPSISISEMDNITSEIKKEFAPDKRVELFDIRFSEKNGKIIIDGETTSSRAMQAILSELIKLENIKLENKVRMLPDSAVGNKIYAVGRNSVINIRSKPKHSAELGTQGLLGMQLKVLDKKGDFYRVQTPDKYISWVDKGGITRMTKEEFGAWKTAKKVIYTNTNGYVYEESSLNSKIVSDISLGGVLKYIDENNSFYQVEYPDKRIGFLSKKEALIYDSWIKNTVANPENIELTAKSMNGFPYLWGGTSAKGMDCSGFTKMVYLMQGFVIPRDASQQINAGEVVDISLTFDGLEKGDLLFFGKKATENSKQRVTHVGIWLGNGKQEFIHSSGNVHLSSMDENHPLYDDFNKNRYLGSRRYLGVDDALIINLREQIKL